MYELDIQCGISKLSLIQRWKFQNFSIENFVNVIEIVHW